MKPRQISIINDLKNNKSIYIAADLIAKKYNVSTKTIYNDINSINNSISKLGIKINKIPRKGIILKLKNNQMQKLNNWLSLYNSALVNERLSPQDRKDFLLKYIYFDKNGYSIEDLAELLYVSDSTVKRDLEIMGASLSEYEVKLYNNDNIINVKGEESKVRKFLREQLSKIILNKLINEEQNTIDIYLAKIFLREDIHLVKQIINKTLSNYDQNLSDYYYSIVIELLIIIYRNRKGYYILDFDNTIIKNLQHLEVYFCASELLSEVSQNGFVLKINETSEVESMSYSLLAAGFKINTTSYNESVSKTVKNLIDNASTLLSLDLNHDSHLKKMLVNHIGPMILRIKNSTTIVNPLLEDIKRQYNILYSIIWFSITDLETEFNIKLTASEVSLLVVHFQIALEKVVQPLKILIVCPHSLATSELIYSKLRSVFSEIDVIEKISLLELQQVNTSNVDLIISTVLIDNNKPKVQYVSPIITEEEIHKIQNKYLHLRSFKSKKIFQSEKHTNYYSNLLKELIGKSVFFIDSLENKYDCLDFLIRQSYAINILDEKFAESIISREKLGSTSVYTGVALPHADPRKVKKSQIVIMRLGKPIQWDQNQVKLIFLLAISEKDTVLFKDLIVSLLQVLGNERAVKEIYKEEEKEGLQKKLLNSFVSVGE